ncbi:oxygenase MpaB family protein [Candidatus Mycobacterium methanotrophicum]|uniref:oxygenase MpaB family protein n=2 Tax=Candidatus Mycobacterium methanotrophicum TaxID=2943498 RepID=UPI00358DA7E6
MAAAAALAVPDRRRGLRRRPRTDDRRRGARLPRGHQGHRQSGPALSRVEPRCLLLGALDLVCRDVACGEAVLRWLDRGAEAPAVRRACAVVPDIWHERAPSPADGEEFGVYWDHMCREVSENDFAARAVLNSTELPKPPFAQWLPDRLWTLQRKLLAPFFVWLTVGLYDPPVRELMGYTWTRRDEWLHPRFGDVVRLVFSCLPRRARMCAVGPCQRPHPGDDPLMRIPARNLPPLDERDNPKHYCPNV